MMEEESVAYIGLGSNMGDRDSYLFQALKKLNHHPNISIACCSSIYETEPYGPVEQREFLNLAAEVHTSLSPESLLKVCQAIECSLGRKRDVHWGPRTIDLDILLYNKENIEKENLKVPHPELSKRLFVLTPLKEINAELIVPHINESIENLYKKLKSEEGVRIWRPNNGEGEFGLFES
ncbi:2-amino-4-hydroxy-6-hydroxymethyldihydropteridine diphosphokinase [Scopulibacillus daqui]|uniref:2-amino-4-hydroxy-6-hydroxymethyldihydropteridine diphosphokinase n=1 Tax=Scopulibacillus daqui TaxID=1469162 RepID=A0ABS2Q2B8_9BACL|nr:2-amino-4-hydroxy-6-hydroxymethyldihydropteridine diphosphokinase [Scopulibacillus daqui]MBM7646438.1 2-amino-4-hydroxy-6-hydroxymethyldihydropteridine diphosphokinase [Scopulibacillus daqui]